MVKYLPASAGDTGSIPGSGRSSEEGNGNPSQYSCLGNPMDRGAWQATVHEVTELDTTGRLSVHTHTQLKQERNVLKEGGGKFKGDVLSRFCIWELPQYGGDDLIVE